jgi:hypothetical protein
VPVADEDGGRIAMAPAVLGRSLHQAPNPLFKKLYDSLVTYRRQLVSVPAGG